MLMLLISVYVIIICCIIQFLVSVIKYLVLFLRLTHIFCFPVLFCHDKGKKILLNRAFVEYWIILSMHCKAGFKGLTSYTVMDKYLDFIHFL